MITEELKYRITTAIGHTPTDEQRQAIAVFADFMADRRDESVMVLSGSAGTGKTTLAAAIVRALAALGQKMVLLAPTGRAAKVFAHYAGTAAFTVHRRIYRQRSLEGGFDLNFNAARDTLFIVDEASMVNSSADGSIFGSGSLLDDLIAFVYGAGRRQAAQGNNCRLLLIGDQAQLPPVGELSSPALQPSVLSSYGLHVYESALHEVLRQAQESGILWNATHIRGYGEKSTPAERGDGLLRLPQVCIQGFTDIHIVPGDELIEQLATSYSRAGLDDTIVITRSNKRAIVYNQGIRRSILDREDELCCGDRLMIVKNNYYWMTASHASNNEQQTIEFLANGDTAVVQRVRNIHEQHGFRFADVTMTLPDYDDYELTATVLLDTLGSEAPSLTREQQTQLYERVMADYADIPLKQDRLKAVRQDRYYNALQVKFAYAVTCHKAQGGQWSHVYIDQGYMTDDMLTPDYLHWLYTAFTRATDQLYLVNWPKTQVSDDRQI